MRERLQPARAHALGAGQQASSRPRRRLELLEATGASDGPVRRGERLGGGRRRSGTAASTPVHRAADRRDELRVQERQVDRGDERDVGVDRLEPGEDPLQRPAALARVVDDADAAGQRRQLLAGRADDDDRPARTARDDPAGAAQQRAPRASPATPSACPCGSSGRLRARFRRACAERNRRRVPVKAAATARSRPARLAA